MTPRRAAVLLLLPLLLVVPPARAEDGGEEFESIPAWVTEPPAREGWIRAVDVGLSNLLELAYSPDRVLRERLNLRWRIEKVLKAVDPEHHKAARAVLLP